MKNKLFFLSVAFATILASCTKEEEATSTTENSYKFSKAITVYTEDKLSNVELVLSSDNSEFIDETISDLKLDAGNICFTDYKVAKDYQESAVATELQTSELSRSIDIKVVKFNSKFTTMILSIEKKANENRLKSVVPWQNTYYYGVNEDDVPYCAVKFKYKSSDPYGIFVQPRHKETWLSVWAYPSNYQDHLVDAAENNTIVQSPWNNNNPTYMHGFKVTTNLTDDPTSGNFSYASSTTPITSMN